MPIAYILVVFGIFIIFGLFWFMNGNNNFRYGYDFSSTQNIEKSVEDHLLLSGLKRLDNYSERGKWILFLSIFLLLSEFFVFIAYLIKSSNTTLQWTGLNHFHILGGIIYFFMLVFAVFIALRLSSINREIPFFTDPYNFKKSLWEKNLSQIPSDQRNNFAWMITEKGNSLEQSYGLALILVTSAVTLLFIWLLSWFFSITI